MAKKSSSVIPLIKNRRNLLLFGTLATFFAMGWFVLSHAWMTDDAYFSFRSIDNFINGYGLTWNVTERVQAYTHPVWVLLLSVFYFFTREIYLTTIVISLVLSLVTASLIYRNTENKWRALAAIGLLSLSTAYIDYSTSGLENPLSHFLLIVFLFIFLQNKSPRKLFWLSFITALAAVNRLDTILFFLPPLVYEWWNQENKSSAAISIALGFLPLAAWEIFSLVYYGFPFPNTYYAKAQNYVALGEEIWAGLNYFLFTLKFDPITWVGILAAFATAIWQRSRQALSIVIGVLLYLLYILQVGGDFMGGRFLSTAYLACVFVLLVWFFPKLQLRKHWVLIPAVLLLSAAASSPPYFLYAKNFQVARWNGVVDERMVYYTTDFLRIEDLQAFNVDPKHNALNRAAYFVRSILRGTLFRFEAENDWIDLGRDLHAQADNEGKLVLGQGANGFTGYYVGPHVYIINNLALTDGLLARVPPIYNPNWRSGHFTRITPAGYLEAEAGTRPGLDDPTLNSYFQKIRLVIEGPLFTAERWQAIWELNTRSFEALLPGFSENFRFPALHAISFETVPQDGSFIELNIDFAGMGAAARIDFPHTLHTETISLMTSAGDNFRVVLLDDSGKALYAQSIYSTISQGEELHLFSVPTRIAATGYSALRLEPIRVFYKEADGSYSLYQIGFK